MASPLEISTGSQLGRGSTGSSRTVLTDEELDFGDVHSCAGARRDSSDFNVEAILVGPRGDVDGGGVRRRHAVGGGGNLAAAARAEGEVVAGLLARAPLRDVYCCNVSDGEDVHAVRKMTISEDYGHVSYRMIKQFDGTDDQADEITWRMKDTLTVRVNGIRLLRTGNPV